MLYVGAEFCPFCAMARLPLTIALSRFGTFRASSRRCPAPTRRSCRTCRRSRSSAPRTPASTSSSTPTRPPTGSASRCRA
ncbi:MAG: DUF929 family protein [Micropruina sp.]|nr:MAG: DUF929 family protein [Micropruina sp.]